MWGIVGVICGVLASTFMDVALRIKKEFNKRDGYDRDVPKLARDSDHSTSPEIMVKLIHAANGKLLEVSTKKPHAMAQGHWEWEHEMYIVQEGQKLSEAVSMVMLLKGLEK
jgi:hypothetical protein